jgi:hypothetical protein
MIRFVLRLSLACVALQSTAHSAAPSQAGVETVVEGGKVVAAHHDWKMEDGLISGEGMSNELVARKGVGPGDFLVRCRLRVLRQKRSAASFFLDDHHFGFEGAKGTLFASGELFGGLRLLAESDTVFRPESWIDFEVRRDQGELRFMINGRAVLTAADAGREFTRIGLRPWRAKLQVEQFSLTGDLKALPPGVEGFSLPVIDLNEDTARQVVVDREPGQYLGHPTTCLLEDGATLLCVYPKGHGRGEIVYQRSLDGGLTWSGRLPTPASWKTSKEVPTLHRVVDAGGRRRLILWSGLHPARLAVSEDDGRNWSELKPVGEWGGIVVMGCLEAIKTRPGHYMAMFHDDGRFFSAKAKSERPVRFKLFKTLSRDGGLTWTFPEVVTESTEVHLCEPGIIRSPDGRQLAVLLRENRRVKNSHVIFSNDEGRTWTEPRELPAELNGDRHTGRYLPDGRLFISFRDVPPKGSRSPTSGDWVGWVGLYGDIISGNPGQYRLRLKENHKGSDCAYPGVEVLPDGTVVTTTYGHWTEGEAPYILNVRFRAEELDRIASEIAVK